MADEQASTGAPVGIFATPELAAARLKLDEVAARRTSTVTYVSAGHCLVIGAPDVVLGAAARLLTAGVEGVTTVHVDPTSDRVSKALTEQGTAFFTVTTLHLDGHLGAFEAEGVAADGATTDLAVSMRRPSGRFDLILDLSATPLLTARLPPPGYVHVSAGTRDHGSAETPEEADVAPDPSAPGTSPLDATASIDAVGPDASSLDAAVETLAGLVGEFDKPRYFAYDASICAHSRSRLPGCTNCLDVCVAGAITSADEGVVVDPYLCQGCGSCATLCPTGAMVYAYPKPSDAIRRTREALTASVPAEGSSRADHPRTLLLHGESAAAAVDAAALPETEVLSMLVEEVSAFGIDYWATMLCAGVGRILIVSDASADNPNRLALEEQATLLRTLLAGLGVGPEVIQLIPSAALLDVPSLPGPSSALTALVTSGAAGVAGEAGRAPAGPRGLRPSAFATHDDKRQTVRTALDALAIALGFESGVGNVAGEVALVPLPAGSPFGHIHVDTDACTLCMACVSTCPAGALLDGQDTPALRMIEANCVQCGLCEQACPENAVSLEARYLRDSVEARRVRTLHEESPFHCVSCHKAFATKGMIETMLGKLAGHWMFEDEKALRRLKMCEDCRVKDIFRDGTSAIDVHAKSPGHDRRS